MDGEALRQRAQALIAAIAAHAEAKLAYEAALDALEDARAKAILEGLEGRNEQARQAELLEKTREKEEWEMEWEDPYEVIFERSEERTEELAQWVQVYREARHQAHLPPEEASRVASDAVYGPLPF